MSADLFYHSHEKALAVVTSMNNWCPAQGRVPFSVELKGAP